MKTRKLSPSLLVIGVALVLLSAVWPWFVPSASLWNDADATELTTSASSLHETMHAHEAEHDHDHFGEVHQNDHPEVLAAADRYRTAQAGLARASFWTARLPAYIRYSGLAVCVLGVAMYAATRGD